MTGTLPDIAPDFRALLERQLGEIEGLQAHAQITHQVQTELLLKRHA